MRVSEEAAGLGWQWAILGKGAMLWATLPAAWQWESGHGVKCGQLLGLLLNQVKGFSSLRGQGLQG